MTRHRRGILLGGLALLLGALAASDISGREAALRREVGPLVDVVVAGHTLSAGKPLRQQDLTVRQVPERFAPSGGFSRPGDLVGLRLANPLPEGADVTPAAVDRGEDTAPGAPVQAGERVVDVVATGTASAILPGTRVDVLVTREGGATSAGRTRLALEDVEVLAAHAVPAATGAGSDAATPRVAASLRVTLRQAVYLTAAQSFARELRLLPRAAGDDRHVGADLAVTDTL
jgi:pilus assembly protein CpaB